MATRPEPSYRAAAPSPHGGRPRRLVLHDPSGRGAYPSVLTERLIRRLVAERCIPDRNAGRRVLLAEADLA